jgi:hypothetical protein
MVEDTSLGWRYDLQATDAASTTVLVPNDGIGRWFLFINPNQNHENLSGLLGGAANDHQHLTTAQVGYLPTADQKGALGASPNAATATNYFVTKADADAESAANDLALAAETTARQAADTAQNQALAAETLRAQTAEGTLTTNLASEATARAAADVDLNNAIAAETLARTGAETTLTNAVSAETTARQNADALLQTNLDTETSARTAADTTLQNNITAEASARTAADTTLQSNIDAETSARTSADAILTANLNTEVTARQAADATLTANLAQEVLDRQATDAAIAAMTVGGDLSGALPNPTVAKIQGVPVSNAAPASGQFMRFNGTTWAPASYPCFSTDFLVADWVADGSDYQLTFNHGLSFVGNKNPQVTVYEVSGGADRLVGGIDVAVTGTTVILTVAGNARFDGNLHLLYPIL